MTLYEARRSQGASPIPTSLSSPPALRIPLGIVVLGLVLVIGIGVGAYALGYRAGVAAGEQSAFEAGQAPAHTSDPLARVPVDPAAATTTTTTGPAVQPGPTGLGPAPAADPRVAGLNYFILAGEIASDRAAEMVTFCRSMGLDVVAVSGNNGRSQVIALPGFGRDERSGAPVKALEASIKAVGAKWKALGRGNGDFRDYYPKLHKGQS